MTAQKRKTHGLRKFLLLVLVLAAYTAYTIYEYGLQSGLSVTLLTWAFFVFATPIADAGFFIAFPVRIITGMRMLHTQFMVWIFGLAVVATYLLTNPEAFAKTPVLELFHNILTTPWPLGLILLLSAAGTYISIRFDDEILDVASSKHKKSKLKSDRTKIYYTAAVFAVTFGLYVFLLRTTNTDIQIF